MDNEERRAVESETADDPRSGGSGAEADGETATADGTPSEGSGAGEEGRKESRSTH